MVCSSRCGTRHVQSKFSKFGEIDVFGRNLRDRFCARSHTSHDAKLGVKMRDWVDAFRISIKKKKNCQDYIVHPTGFTIFFSFYCLHRNTYLLNIRTSWRENLHSRVGHSFLINFHPFVVHLDKNTLCRNANAYPCFPNVADMNVVRGLW